MELADFSTNTTRPARELVVSDPLLGLLNKVERGSFFSWIESFFRQKCQKIHLVNCKDLLHIFAVYDSKLNIFGSWTDGRHHGFWEMF